MRALAELAQQLDAERVDVLIDRAVPHEIEHIGRRIHLGQQFVDIHANGRALLLENLASGAAVAPERKQIAHRERGLGHSMIGAMHECRRELAIVIGRLHFHSVEHVIERMQGFIEIARRRILAVEHRQILEVTVQGAADDVA